MSPVMRAAICLGGPVLTSILVLVLATGCARAGEVRTERRSVELEGAESVRTDLSMGTGDILVGGGAENLMDATFTYNVPRWKPEVSYRGHEDSDVSLNLSVRASSGDINLRLAE
jgi:hypothetical protein